MKYSEMVKDLKARGCRFVRHGARHDEWISPAGKTFYVPRHQTHDVPKGTYNAILTQAGLK